MKSRWLYWGLGFCIAYIILRYYLPYGVFGIFGSPYFYFGVFLVAYILYSIIIIENENKIIIYLLGLAINVLLFFAGYMIDNSHDEYLFKAMTIFASIIYTSIVLIALGISYLIKKAKKNGP
ncbi:MAG: hypothetical protein WBK78_12480 [Syntrophomonadaceae bacterium]